MGVSDRNYLDAVRKSVTLPEILSSYGIEIYGSRAKCPIHGSDRQFSLSFTDEVFHCFQCKKSGSVLDFVAAMENCDIYDAAAKIATHYKIESNNLFKTRDIMDRVEKYKLITKNEFEEVGGFHLESLIDFRGLTQQTIDKFGLAYIRNEGTYIPTRDLDGRDINYSIRRPEGVVPKYKNATGISGRSLLYGLYENQKEITKQNQAIVVEGQLDCVSMYDKGFQNCVALCGSSMTIQQALTLMQYTKNIVLMLDGDEAGQNGMVEIQKKYNSLFNIRIVNLPINKDPEELDVTELWELLSWEKLNNV